jgi:hypothetical protein
MSTIAAGTTSGTALVSTGNTAGTLVFQTNGTTTALTLGTDQSATFAGAVTAPSFSGTSSTATNLAGGSNGTIPYQSAAGTTQMLAAGTSGQLLQTNGAGAPSWVTASASPMVYLSTLTASNSATITYTGLNSTYFAYMVVMKNLKCVSGSGPTLVLQMRMSDTSILSVSAVGIGYNSQAASTAVYPTNISLPVLASSDNANTAGASGNLYIYSPSTASQVTTGLYHTAGTTYQGIGGTFFATGGFQAISSLASSGFRLSYSTGNIESGSVDIYGIKNS